MFTIDKKKRSNSLHFTPTLELQGIDDVIKYLTDNNVRALGRLYMFTHIPLSDGSIITEHASLGLCPVTGKSRDMLVSPERLARTLDLKTIY